MHPLATGGHQPTRGRESHAGRVRALWVRDVFTPCPEVAPSPGCHTRCCRHGVEGTLHWPVAGQDQDEASLPSGRGHVPRLRPQHQPCSGDPVSGSPPCTGASWGHRPCCHGTMSPGVSQEAQELTAWKEATVLALREMLAFSQTDHTSLTS